MSNRPKLDKSLDGNTFKSFYYLKEELVEFCKTNNIPASGSKLDITERIALFLDEGIVSSSNSNKRIKHVIKEISLNTIIEDNIVCSEIHRSFFKEHIGKSFSFNVLFQKWLKENAGKTYSDAVNAYYEILEQKKTNKTTIDKQFEYNTYIREFFNDNQGLTLDDAIKCWKYKKSKCGHHKYEKSDLAVLKK